MLHETICNDDFWGNNAETMLLQFETIQRCNVVLCWNSRRKSSGVTSPWGLNEKSCPSYHQFFVRRRKASWPEGKKIIIISKTSGYIRYFRNQKGKRVEMCPTIVSGMVTGDALVSFRSFFISVPSNSPRGLCKGKLDPVLFSYLKWPIVVKSELKQRHLWEETGRKLGFNDRYRKGGHKIYFRHTTIFSFKISLSYYWPTKRETWIKLTLINIKAGRLNNPDSKGNENVKIIITTTTNRFNTQNNNFARASHF